MQQLIEGKKRKKTPRKITGEEGKWERGSGGGMGRGSRGRGGEDSSSSSSSRSSSSSGRSHLKGSMESEGTGEKRVKGSCKTEKKSKEYRKKERIAMRKEEESHPRIHTYAALPADRVK